VRDSAIALCGGVGWRKCCTGAVVLEAVGDAAAGLGLRAARTAGWGVGSAGRGLGHCGSRLMQRFGGVEDARRGLRKGS